jgi:hypothetical protein
MNVDINELNDTEKLSLITLLWESIGQKEKLPINEAHVQILLEREKSNKEFVAWDEVEKKIRKIFR